MEDEQKCGRNMRRKRRKREKGSVGGSIELPIMKKERSDGSVWEDGVYNKKGS